MYPQREKVPLYQREHSKDRDSYMHQAGGAQTASFILGSKDCPLWQNQSDVACETLKAHYAN